MSVEHEKPSAHMIEDDDLKIEHPATGMDMPPNLAALSEAEYAKLAKWATVKMDIVIMPIMVIMYILNYLDRQNIASAKLANITDDLSLSPVQYQTTISILFVGYSTFSI